MEKEVITNIKKDLRASMNGVASAAMRQTADYRVNFGVELPRLQQIAADYPIDRELAQALWHEGVRECRILATMLMPKDVFDEELCDIWVSEIKTAEIGQIFALNLMRDMPYASQKAFEWISRDNTMLQMIGYFTMCHVLRKGPMNDQSKNELIDQIACDIHDITTPLGKAALKALQTFANQSDENNERAKNIADYLL